MSAYIKFVIDQKGLDRQTEQYLLLCLAERIWLGNLFK